MLFLKGIWIPRFAIFCYGLSDGLLKNVSFNSNYCFYFEKKIQDLYVFTEKMLQKLMVKNKKLVCEGNDYIRKYKELKALFSEIEQKKKGLTGIRATRNLLHQKSEIGSELERTKKEIIQIYHKYLENKSAFTETVVSNQNRLQVLFLQYYKGVKFSRSKDKEKQIVIPEVDYRKSEGYEQYIELYIKLEKKLYDTMEEIIYD